MPKIGQKLRSEQEIFDELEGLCASPGYVHAIAFLCFRDSLIRYQGEMTSEDMKHLFSREHLVRTEISTLVGLLVKADIDYSLPAPAITQQHLERTEELLEELHRAMGMSPTPSARAMRFARLSSTVASQATPFSIVILLSRSTRRIMRGSHRTSTFPSKRHEKL
jgi:hypothetical protein